MSMRMTCRRAASAGDMKSNNASLDF